jgi:hypothetical protein
MSASYTERGFAAYATIDTDYGHSIRVQESSSAEQPKCWPFIEPSEMVEGYNVHLTGPQAVRLIAALAEFVQDSGQATGALVEHAIAQLAVVNELAPERPGAK